MAKASVQYVDPKIPAATPNPNPYAGWIGLPSTPNRATIVDTGISDFYSRTQAGPSTIQQPSFSNNTMIQPSSINPNPGSDTPTIGRITPKSPGVNSDVNKFVQESPAPAPVGRGVPSEYAQAENIPSYYGADSIPQGFSDVPWSSPYGTDSAIGKGGAVITVPSQYTQDTIAAPSKTQAEIDALSSELSGLEAADTAAARTEATNANVRGVANVAASAISESSRAAANMASIEHANDMEQWKQSGAYWFDPNSDLKPDLDAYLAKQPSKFDSIKKGTLTGGKWTGGGYDDNPGGTLAVSFLNPAGGTFEALGGKKYAGFAEYSGNKSGERALQGLGAGGWIGAIAGAVVGTIEGVFSWNSAKAEDQKNKAAARDEYMLKLKEWQYNKNKTREATIMAQRQQAAAYEAARATKRVASKKSAQADQRAAFLAMINQAAQNKQANIQSLKRTR